MRIETADQIAVVADTDGGLLMQFGPTTVELSPAEAEAFVIALSDALPDTDGDVDCDADECEDCDCEVEIDAETLGLLIIEALTRK